jgi:hypothetical protein
LVVKVAQVETSPYDNTSETANISDPIQRAVDSPLRLDTVQGGTNLYLKKSFLRLLVIHHLWNAILHRKVMMIYGLT